ncbi:MAG: poly-gamma-glutamate system protein [candidate division Zixibacteria bacterium]|nr:poly-gamma-glutamate system protein [candidate division Zixibacteria bacterium]
MTWREGRIGDGALVGLALFAVLIFYAAEHTARPIQQPRYRAKLRAAELAKAAQREVKSFLNEKGIKIDARNDPWGSGLIGEERTPITSDRGVATAKILATNPNFAAGFVDLFNRAGVKKGDTIAVGMTGSLPGWNVAFYAACAALELTPISIVSVGASDWGATRPDLTWLDMEDIVAKGGVWDFHAVAASLGGGGDYGRGLSPDGRNMVRQAIARNQVKLIEERSLEGNIERRMQIYDSIAGSAGSVSCFVNIGGGLADMGGALNNKLIPPGVTRHLARRNYPVRAVLNRMAERGLPIINLSNVVHIADQFELPTVVTPDPPTVGEGSLYFRDQYNISSAIILTVILTVVVFIVIRVDLRPWLFRRRTQFTNA